MSIPYILKYKINSILENDLNNYSGKIENVSLSFSRNKFTINELIINKNNSRIIELTKLTGQFSWQKLFNKKLFLDLTLDNLEINLYLNDGNKENINEPSEHWTSFLNKKIPISVNRLSIKNSKVIFNTLKIKGLGKLTIAVDDLEASEAIILKDDKASLPQVSAKAHIHDYLSFKIMGGIDVTKKNLPMDLDLVIDKFDLKSINKSLINYIPVNLTSGELYLAAEYKGDINKAKGYFKLFIENLDIIETNQKYISIDHVAMEWILGFANWALQEITEPTISVRIPFKLDNEFNVNTSKAFWSTLKNSKTELNRDIESI